MHQVPGGMVAQQIETAKSRHPSVFEPVPLALNIVLSVIGAIIGLQLITQLGITANTAIIGALVAMLVGRVPVGVLQSFRSIHRQNLIQTGISGATFGAANSLLLPVGVPFALGRPDLVWPMLIGAGIGLFVDAWLMYRLFDSRIFPASAAWPPGVATAEAILAGDEGGRRARLLFWGTIIGLIGSIFKIPMSAFGVTFIGNVWALSMFGIGLLLRGYSQPLWGLDLNALYIPHGIMIGAGVVALLQITFILLRRMEDLSTAGGPAGYASNLGTPVDVTVDERTLGRVLVSGFTLYIMGAVLLAVVGGLLVEMPIAQLVLWVLFAAFAALVSELIVGLSAMHAGWFPAFATTLIFLVLGMIMGFPAVPLALLTGYTASTGPAFADMGYDLKAGWLLRRREGSRAFELEGRREQFRADVLAFIIAAAIVALVWPNYFEQDLLPPVDRVFAATIQAGVEDQSILRNLVLAAIPGALIQFVGGPARQMGILFATGLLINMPLAGWAVLAGILVRLAISRRYGSDAETPMSITAAGIIAGDALYSFFSSIVKIK